MSSGSSGIGQPDISKFIGRFSELNEKKGPISSKVGAANLEKILQASIIFLRNSSENKKHANGVAQFLMGRAKNLPDGIKLAHADIPPELQTTLSDLLRTNRYGINPESSDKTIAKLEYLLQKIEKNNSGALISAKQKESLQQAHVAQSVSPPLARDPATEKSEIISDTGLLESLHDIPIAQSETPPAEHPDSATQNIAIDPTDLSTSQQFEDHQFTSEEINDWLFNGKSHALLPEPTPNTRLKNDYAPKLNLDDVEMIGKGKFSSKVGIYVGNITDLEASDNQKVSAGCIISDDLCMNNVIKCTNAIMHAAGAEIQREIFNTYSEFRTNEDTTKEANDQSLSDETENANERTNYGERTLRYSYSDDTVFPCGAYEMKDSHKIHSVQVMLVPETFEQWRDRCRLAIDNAMPDDFIILPVISLAEDEKALAEESELISVLVREFYSNHPDLNLKIILNISNGLQEEIPSIKQQYTASMLKQDAH